MIRFVEFRAQFFKLSKGVKKVQVSLRSEKGLMLMLTVDINQQITDVMQKGQIDPLIVDVTPTSSTRTDLSR